MAIDINNATYKMTGASDKFSPGFRPSESGTSCVASFSAQL